MKSDLKRRAFLSGAAALFASPAISQVKGPFDLLGPNADPKDLIDQVWDPVRASFLTIRDLLDTLADSEIILVGERHGFAAHQERVAFLIKALADRGRYPTLALEMLQPSDDPVIAGYRRENPEYARRLGIALDWAASGWPDWSFYEPIFDAAFAAKLPVIGADLPLSDQIDIERNGLDERPSDPSILESWKASMFEAHCGLIDEDRTLKLALKQWRRDEAMARAAQSSAVGALALMGREHTIPSRSVPRHLTKAHVCLDLSSEPGEANLTWITEPQTNPAGKLCG